MSEDTDRPADGATAAAAEGTLGVAPSSTAAVAAFRRALESVHALDLAEIEPAVSFRVPKGP